MRMQFDSIDLGISELMAVKEGGFAVAFLSKCPLLIVVALQLRCIYYQYGYLSRCIDV